MDVCVHVDNVFKNIWSVLAQHGNWCLKRAQQTVTHFATQNVRIMTYFIGMKWERCTERSTTGMDCLEPETFDTWSQS